jgi:hypothetical protein
MTRMATGLCVAAALSVATLGAQTPAPTTTERSDAAKEITLTGCLSKGADGKYMLTNAKLDNPSTATTGTSGTTTPPTSTPATTAGSMNTAASWTLSGGTDLDKHVGHKIQVTGKAAMDATMDHRTPDSTAAAAGSAAAGTVGTSGSTATAAEEQRKETKDTAPRLDVSSVKMVAATCS